MCSLATICVTKRRCAGSICDKLASTFVWPHNLRRRTFMWNDVFARVLDHSRLSSRRSQCNFQMNRASHVGYKGRTQKPALPLKRIIKKKKKLKKKKKKNCLQKIKNHTKNKGSDSPRCSRANIARRGALCIRKGQTIHRRASQQPLLDSS